MITAVLGTPHPWLAGPPADGSIPVSDLFGLYGRGLSAVLTLRGRGEVIEAKGRAARSTPTAAPLSLGEPVRLPPI
jgi:hypothetical protein